MNKRSTPGCPICGAASAKKYAPFCSSKCADHDLANWLNGNYAIPAADDDEDGFDEAAESGQIDPSGPTGTDSIH